MSTLYDTYGEEDQVVQQQIHYQIKLKSVEKFSS
jgi:hypothetical protein